MKTEKAKALNEFLNSAADLLLSIVGDGVVEPKMRLINIEELTEENFEKYYSEFEQELQQNILEYKDYDIIYNYINHYLHAIYVWQGFGSEFIKKIFAFESQSNILLKAKQLIDSYKQKIVVLLGNDLFINSLRRFMNDVLYPEDKTPKTDEFKPESKFAFDEIKQEIANDKLATIKAIALINDRVCEFKQWKMINDTENDYDAIGNVVGKKHPISNMHYPQFEELCKLEVDKLKNTVTLEKAELTNKTIEKNPIIIQNQVASPYKWNDSATDFLELIAALHQKNSIVRKDGKKLPRIEIIKYFMDFYNLEIKDVEGMLTRATNRKMNMTPFLDSLKVAFENYGEEKEKKLDSRR